jgi:hypothetical protein
MRERPLPIQLVGYYRYSVVTRRMRRELCPWASVGDCVHVI